VLLSLAILIALPLVLDHIAHPDVPPALVKMIRWPILFVFIVLALSFIYRFGPSRSAPRWRWITWGSAFAAIAWLIASASFLGTSPISAATIRPMALGAIIGFMTWIWVSIIVVLVGAKLNAEIVWISEQEHLVTVALDPISSRYYTHSDNIAGCVATLQCHPSGRSWPPSVSLFTAGC
jgi:membrane protein